MEKIKKDLKFWMGGLVGVFGPLGILALIWFLTKDDAAVFLVGLTLIPVSLAFLLMWVFAIKPTWQESVQRLTEKIRSPWNRWKEDFDKSPSRIQALVILLLAVIFIYFFYRVFGDSNQPDPLDPYVPFGD